MNEQKMEKRILLCSYCTVVQNKESLSKRWPSKIRPFPIRNICADAKIPKISQKCREKLRFLIYFWFERCWYKTYVSWYIFYIGGVLKRVLKSSAKLYAPYFWIVIHKHIFKKQFMNIFKLQNRIFKYVSNV